MKPIVALAALFVATMAAPAWPQEVRGAALAIDGDTLSIAGKRFHLRGIDALYVAHLGLPPQLWARMGIEVGPIFAPGRVLPCRLKAFREFAQPDPRTRFSTPNVLTV